MAMGLVESLSRPGRNATGFSDILAELSGKFVDLAREVINISGLPQGPAGAFRGTLSLR
jgi:hypothetical protein